MKSPKRLEEEYLQALFLGGFEEAERIRTGRPLDPQWSENGETLLHIACKAGIPAAVALLLGSGADPERRTDRAGGEAEQRQLSATPLMLAAGSMADGRGCMDLLLQRGVDLHARDGQGRSALFHALRFPDRVALLLAAGADPNIADDDGLGPLMLARDLAADPLPRSRLRGFGGQGAGPDEAGSVALLERAGAKAIGEEGRRARDAAAAGDRETLVALLDAGVCPDHRDVSPLLACAAGEGHRDLVELLLARGATVDRPDTIGETALGYAAGNGHIETVKLLLEHGADPLLGAAMRPLQHVKQALENARRRGRATESWEALLSLLREAEKSRTIKPQKAGAAHRQLLDRLGLPAKSTQLFELDGLLILESALLDEVTTQWQAARDALPAGWSIALTTRALAEVEPVRAEVRRDLQEAQRLRDCWQSAIAPEERWEERRRELAAFKGELPAGAREPLGLQGPQRVVLTNGPLHALVPLYRFGGWNACPRPALLGALLASWQERFGLRLVRLGNDSLELVTEPPLTEPDRIRQAALELGMVCDEGQEVEEQLRLAASAVVSLWWD